MSEVILPAVRTQTENLTEKTFNAICDAIVSKVLAPGMRLSESALAAQLNVSKTPVRESLLRLTHVGLVKNTSRGLCVIQPSRHSIQEAYEYRAAIERSTAQLASLRAGKDNVAEIYSAAEESLRAAKDGDGQTFRNWDKLFHSRVGHSAGNEILDAAVQDALLLSSALRQRDVPTTGDSVVCATEHVSIAEAIRDGDPAAAAMRMGRHIEHVMSIVLESANENPTGLKPL